jgi:Glycosyltransferase (GlcNAc)
LVLVIYLYGVLQSLYALPEIALQLAPPLYPGHEANLNVAMDKYETVSGVQAMADGMPVVLAASTPRDRTKQWSDTVKRTQLEDVQIPRHVWPPSIKNEPDRFETINHPADGHTTLSVPLFWSPPLHQNGLMTKELALSIGSCSVPDPTTGLYNRGEDCPEDDRTIYFAIASYRDFQCRFTVESAFGRAKNPKRIRVGTWKSRTHHGVV